MKRSIGVSVLVFLLAAAAPAEQVIRISSYKALPGKFAEVSKVTDEEITGVYAGMRGLKWVRFYYDPATGDRGSVTLWADRAALDSYMKSEERKGILARLRPLIDGDVDEPDLRRVRVGKKIARHDAGPPPLPRSDRGGCDRDRSGLPRLAAIPGGNHGPRARLPPGGEGRNDEPDPVLQGSRDGVPDGVTGREDSSDLRDCRELRTGNGLVGPEARISDHRLFCDERQSSEGRAHARARRGGATGREGLRRSPPRGDRVREVARRAAGRRRPGRRDRGGRGNHRHGAVPLARALR